MHVLCLATCLLTLRLYIKRRWCSCDKEMLNREETVGITSVTYTELRYVSRIEFKFINLVNREMKSAQSVCDVVVAPAIWSYVTATAIYHSRWLLNNNVAGRRPISLDTLFWMWKFFIVGSRSYLCFFENDVTNHWFVKRIRLFSLCLHTRALV